MTLRKRHTRKTGNRSASLLVIAVEGMRTEQQYFSQLRDEIHNSRYKVVVLTRPESESGESAPRYIYGRLLQEAKNLALGKNDVCCLVVDRDQGSFKMNDLKDIAKQCADKGFIFALSNPCFEIWFFLHRKCLSDLSELQTSEMLQYRSVEMQNAVRIANGGSFNPKNIDLKEWLPALPHAIERAELADRNPTSAWPDYLATRVYRVVQKIMEMK